MKDNKENGTILDRLKVIKLGSNKYSDLVEYVYSHHSGDHGPYQAYIPRGQVKALELKEGLMYRIKTVKIGRQVSLG